MRITQPLSEISRLTEQDVYLFNEGTHSRLYEKMGAHLREGGTSFAVWAPDAEQVSVIGDFNGWERGRHPLAPHGQSGIWEGFIPGIGKGQIYKYHITSRRPGYRVDKADPFAFFCEVPPKTASVVWGLDYGWSDDEWMKDRRRRNGLQSPISIYEVHLGSWMRMPEEGGRVLSYREIAPRLADYARKVGFTHVEFLPVMEHPFYGSWGYQGTGYFAPTSRYGTPQDFMFLVDTLHQNGIGVILDWVPSHFATDEHGLGLFDGTHLYEHADDKQGIHPDWNSYVFNYGRNEVRSFLLSSALFWLDRFHADGLRLDAVASMLYLDYSRKPGEWIPNPHGGRENLQASQFLRRLNEEAYRLYPDIQMFAEESTAWRGVTQPVSAGGLGFGMKWDMGWMHDTLDYVKKEPVHRKFHHNTLTFRMLYAFTENFVLALSHDEVVHGKSSLLGKMPGDDWQKFANARLLLGYQFAQPGKKLLFMGMEFGQWGEWHHDEGLDWPLARHDRHAGLQRWVTDLNRLLREEPALHELDFEAGGFEWLIADDADNSVTAFLRKGKQPGGEILVVCNWTPVPRTGYRVGVPRPGVWRELLNSDAKEYWGSGWGNLGRKEAEKEERHGQPCSLSLALPPLSVLFLKP